MCQIHRKGGVARGSAWLRARSSQRPGCTTIHRPFRPALRPGLAEVASVVGALGWRAGCRPSGRTACPRASAMTARRLAAVRSRSTWQGRAPLTGRSPCRNRVPVAAVGKGSTACRRTLPYPRCPCSTSPYLTALPWTQLPSCQHSQVRRRGQRPYPRSPGPRAVERAKTGSSYPKSHNVLIGERALRSRSRQRLQQ